MRRDPRTHGTDEPLFIPNPDTLMIRARIVIKHERWSKDASRRKSFFVQYKNQSDLFPRWKYHEGTNYEGNPYSFNSLEQANECAINLQTPLPDTAYQDPDYLANIKYQEKKAKEDRDFWGVTPAPMLKGLGLNIEVTDDPPPPKRKDKIRSEAAIKAWKTKKAKAKTARKFKEHPRKLTREKVEEIKRLLRIDSDVKTKKLIARQYDISRSTVDDIHKKRTWKNVK